ncbi:MAG: DUF1501 domain-containing protein [Planctomycetes bacterium]|nr:DUF1501 domain-containing protein [Planctomycetota bacterium]
MEIDRNHGTSSERSLVARRWFLQQCGVGLGAAALAAEFTADGFAGERGNSESLSQEHVRPLHFEPKAKRVIYLFMAGAPSHLELFDYKPKLAELDGQLPPPGLLEGYRAAFINPNSRLLGPKFKFARYGQSGAELSELLPKTAEIVDEMAIVRSMVTDAFNHAPAQLLMNTGAQQFGRPSFGAWSLYGLGNGARDLPGFVVFSTGSKGPSGGNSCWGSGFLPTVHQGVTFRVGAEPVLYLANPPGIDGAMQRDSLETIQGLNQHRLSAIGDPEIATRIRAYEMAGQMQNSAPDLIDLAREPQHILDLYGAEPGKSTFANAALLARRLVERGVRFVQIYHEAWDQHGNLVNDLKKNCKNTDQACAALITDLKQRGLLQDTLVIWGGEFGRTPMVQGGNDGRDHHPSAFTVWMAGGGIKPGLTLGSTDELGFHAVEDRVHVHDLHATLLQLLGFDHARLTFKFQGRMFRLTDVHGQVVKKLLA